MGYVGDSWGIGFCVWCMVISLGFILLYFLGVYAKNTGENSSAQDILDKRYANGEINKQVYEDCSNALKRIA